MKNKFVVLGLVGIFLLALLIRIYPVLRYNLPTGQLDAAQLYVLSVSFYDNNLKPLDKFPLNNPYYPGEPYQFGITVPELSAIFMKLGISERIIMLNVVATFISAGTIFMAYLLSYKISKNWKMSLLVALLFGLSLRDIFVLWWGNSPLLVASLMNLGILYFFVDLLEKDEIKAKIKTILFLSILVGIEVLTYVKAMVWIIPMLVFLYLFEKNRKVIKTGIMFDISKFDEQTIKNGLIIFVVIALVALAISGFYIFSFRAASSLRSQAYDIFVGHLLEISPLGYTNWYFNPITSYGIVFFLAIGGFLASIRKNLLPSFFVASFLATYLLFFGIGIGSIDLPRIYIFETFTMVFFASYFIFNLPKKLKFQLMIITVLFSLALAFGGMYLQKPDSITQGDVAIGLYLRQTAKSTDKIYLATDNRWIPAIAKIGYTFNSTDNYQYIYKDGHLAKTTT